MASLFLIVGTVFWKQGLKSHVFPGPPHCCVHVYVLCVCPFLHISDTTKSIRRFLVCGLGWRCPDTLPIDRAMWKPEFRQACVRDRPGVPAAQLTKSATPCLVSEPSSPPSVCARNRLDCVGGKFQLQESAILFSLLHYLW